MYIVQQMILLNVIIKHLVVAFKPVTVGDLQWTTTTKSTHLSYFYAPWGRPTWTQRVWLEMLCIQYVMTIHLYNLQNNTNISCQYVGTYYTLYFNTNSLRENYYWMPMYTDWHVRCACAENMWVWQIWCILTRLLVKMMRLEIIFALRAVI